MIERLWLFGEADVIGGAEIFTLRLGAFLAGRGGPAMQVFAPAASRLHELCADAGIESRTVELPPMGTAGAPRWPGAIAAARRLLRSAGNDVLVVGNTPRAQACLLAAALLAGPRPPIVFAIHEMETLKRRIGPRGYRRADGLVAMGGRAAEACRARLPGVPVQQANLFVDWDEVGPAPPPPAGGRPVIGVLGRLIPAKGQLDLVEELAQAEDSWSRVILAGTREDEGYARRVEARVADLGLAERISLPGHLDDTASFFAGLDVLLFPSTGSEGQGLAIVEALAHGRPAIVRRGVFSPVDYDGLPVLPYEGADELRRALGRLPGGAIPRDELRRRFGPEQALEAILAAAGDRG